MQKPGRLREVLIRGDGVAARCCARLLKKAGFRIAMEFSPRARVPAVMLSDRALALIRDVFEQASLFEGLNLIDRRTVAWGQDAKPITVPHFGVVIPELILLESLSAGFEADSLTAPDFVIHTSTPLPGIVEEHHFGERRAFAAEVVLKDGGDCSGCWIESLNEGWLFLIPVTAEAAWLLGVGAPIESQLATSRVIAPRIELRGVASGNFPTSPRILSPLCGDGWIACGSAAIAFDPICGDGVAQAIREAILASAVIRAIADGGDAASLFAHYEARLTAGMLRHLVLCADFYRIGDKGPWWHKELRSLTEGQRWCEAKLAGAGAPRYQLRDYVLESRVRG